MKNKLPLFFFLIVPLVIIFFRLFDFSYVGANDLPFIYSDQLKDSFARPFTWITKYNDAFGVYNVPILWAWSYDFLFGFFARLGFSYGVLIKLLGIFPAILLGAFGMWKLLGSYKLNALSCYIGVLFFISNTYFLELIDGGQIQISLAYALFPLLFLYSRKAIFNSNLIYKVKVAGLWLLLSVFDIRFVYIAGMMVGLHFLVQLIYFRKNIKSLLVSFFAFFGVVGILLLLYHSYWILPALLTTKELLPVTYTRASQINFLSFASLGHLFFVQQPHWYRNVFGQIMPPLWYFAFIPLFALLSIFSHKKRIISFWLLLFFLGVILVKGSQPPFTDFYEYLFRYIPGFSLYRDPSKFFIFICLSISVLLAFSFQLLWEKIEQKKLLYVLYGSFSVLLLMIVSPVWLGFMTGIFSVPVMKQEYVTQANIIKADPKFSRILWLPVKPPLGYSSNIHPSIEGQTLYQKRPFTVAIQGDYELFNFLREASYSGELLDVANVGYISNVPPNPKRDEIKADNIEYYYRFIKQLEDRVWMKERITDSPIPLLKLSDPVGEVFSPKELWVVFGSDDIYGLATSSASQKLRYNGLVFAEEYPGFLEKYPTLFKYSKIVLQDKSLLDLAASYVSESQYIFPAKELDFEPNKTGWWKREAADLIRWRKFLNEKYGLDSKDFDLSGGWAVGEGQRTLELRNKEFIKDSVLLARVMESSQSGVIQFKQQGKSLGSITTKSEQTKFKWFEVGSLKTDGSLEIQTDGPINVVNALAVIAPRDWIVIKNKIEELKPFISEYQNSKVEDNFKLEYRKIDPTHYKVVVSELKKPGTLVFSQSFDPLWKLDGQTPFPVYSLFNGYIIEKEGSFDLYYEPQKYVIPGLVLSVITLLSLSYIYLTKK